MDENELYRYNDPLWYDRVGADEPPGFILDAAAHLVLLLLASFVALLKIYWYPDRLWFWTLSRIKQYQAARTKRF